MPIKTDPQNPYHLPPKSVSYHVLGSAKYAIDGIILAFKREPNLSIQLSIGIIFCLLGIINGRWASALANLILMGLVISLEMINTAIETLCDLVHPEYNIRVKLIKDMAAGAVLITALVWLVVIIYQILTLIGVQKAFNL